MNRKERKRFDNAIFFYASIPSPEKVNFPTFPKDLGDSLSPDKDKVRRVFKKEGIQLPPSLL